MSLQCRKAVYDFPVVSVIVKAWRHIQANYSIALMSTSQGNTNLLHSATACFRKRHTNFISSLSNYRYVFSPFLGFSDVDMDTATRSGKLPPRNDSAHLALSTGVNSKSVAQLVAE